MINRKRKNKNNFIRNKTPKKTNPNRKTAKRKLAKDKIKDMNPINKCLVK